MFKPRDAGRASQGWCRRVPRAGGDQQRRGLGVRRAIFPWKRTTVGRSRRSLHRAAGEQDADFKAVGAQLRHARLFQQAVDAVRLASGGPASLKAASDLLLAAC